MRKKIKIESGMTLVEVVIAISIISIIAVYALSHLRTQIFKGTDARRKAELRRIGQALEEYENDNSCYPLPSQITCDPGTGLQPYLGEIPCDPQTHTSYLYVTDGTVCSKWYKLYTIFTNDQDVDYRTGLGPGGIYNYIYSSPNAPAE